LDCSSGATAEYLYSQRIFKNCVPNTTILTVSARDEDYSDRNLQYFITPAEATRLVNVLPDGRIVKSDVEQFDRESNEKINFTVQATDHANCSSVVDVDIVILDINDNSPEFVNTPYLWNVSEGPTGLGQSFRFAAHDKDTGENERVMFRIIHGNADQSFSLTNLENNTAIIMVKNELDRESKATVLLLVEARDRGVPSLFSATPVLTTFYFYYSLSPSSFTTSLFCLLFGSGKIKRA
uniref:Cadherin domain-containing protein n=1 Tax=Soboliphyme baturini TaxID=241478 RepID=A0A183J7M0_9BILA